MKAIDIFDILIVIAETGAGKTTQIPKFLYLAGYTVLGKVGITQPRRVAAINVATRVSFELNKILGDEIGYVIRFEDMTNENTLVKFMTDGILLKELVGSPLLQKYAIIILDEAHERTIFTDVLFTLLRELIYYRKSLKLLICSATINSVKFSKFFNNAPLFQIPGRSFKIQVYHTRDTQFDYLDSVVLTIFQISLKYTYGDILVFLTGQEDIEIIEEIVKRRLKLLKYFRLKFEILPFYSNLSFDAQKRVFSQKREGFRRIILATNIAETSVTIVGVTYVVDSGLCKLKIYNPITRYESLIITPISKSSAWQRSGRAGRVSSGKTYRLYTLSTYKNILNKTTLPEISRANIGFLVFSR
jgi:pre-mRNA-splicing factor ATP-dependent RNA helicase DHX16